MTTERERFEEWLAQFRELAPLHGPVLWEAWQAALSAPPGFVLVPVEPTPEMAQSLIDYRGDDELWWPTDVSPNYALAAYRVLIAAAPKEPT